MILCFLVQVNLSDTRYYNVATLSLFNVFVIASSIAGSLNGLAINISMPACLQLSLSWEEALAVRATIYVLLGLQMLLDLNCLVASKPLSIGIIQSIKIRS